MTWTIFKMMFVLGMICLSLILVARMLKKNRTLAGDAGDHSGIRVLSTQYLAPQKYISLVDVGGEVLAIGISESQITFLTKIENREFVERMREHRLIKPASSFPFHAFQTFFMNPKTVKKGFWSKMYGN